MTLSLGKQLTGRVSVGGELLTTGEVPAAIAIGTLVVLANTCGSDGLNDDLFSPPPPPPSHEPPRAVEQSQDSGVSALGADLWLHWDVVTRKKWSLFADASIGLMTFHRPFPNFDGAFTSAVVRNGLGVSYRLSESMFLQGGVRHMLLAELGSNDYRRGLEYWVGIGFRF